MAAIYVPTSAIWKTWTSSTTSITTNGTASDYIYGRWIYESATSTTTSSTIYTYWVNEIEEIRANQMQQAIEREQAIQQMREHTNREYEKRLKEKQQARRKAKILLLENLDMDQIKEMNDHGHFFVKSPAGRLYRIREGRAINIDLMKGNSRIDVEKRLCAHPGIDCPNEDTMLAQKVYLEHMEQEFLRIANQYDPVRH